ALQGYVLTPPSVDHEVVEDLNLSLRANVTASSNNDDGYDEVNKVYTGTEYRYLSNDNAPNGDWTSVFEDMTASMMDEQGRWRYEALVIGALTADGVRSTYWTPSSGPIKRTIDMADGEAWVG